MRSTLGFYANDVDKTALNTYEKLNDQEYLTAINRVYRQLKHNGSLTNDYLEDVKKCIYAGQLSPYLYKLMKGEKLPHNQGKTDALGLPAWQTLADKIIAIMPNIEYSSNFFGHPAGRHLVEIVDYLLGGSNIPCHEDSAIEISLKAFNANSEAGGDLFSRLSKLTLHLSPTAEEHYWHIYRSAFNNEKITPRLKYNEKSEWYKINWSFIYSLQNELKEEQANPTYFCWISCLDMKVILDDQDLNAIDRIIDLFNDLISLEKENLSYLIHDSNQNKAIKDTFFASEEQGRVSWIKRLEAIKSRK